MDLRYALRTLGRNKAFATAAIATLAIGIGANTAVFSVFDALLIKSLPVRNPEELVMFQWLRTPDSMVAAYSGYGRPGPAGAGIRTSFSYLTFERFRDHNATLSDVFAVSPARGLNVVAGGLTDTPSAQLVTGNYFAGLGVRPSIGRIFTSSDDTEESEPVAVITHRYWQRRFESDPKIVGTSIDVNRTRVVIVGVTPEGFHGVRASESTDLTLPMAMAARLEADGKPRPVSVWWVEIMGRLKPGVTREQALADLPRVFVETVRESWAARSPDTPNQTRAGVPQLRIVPGGQGAEGPRLDALPILAILFAIVGAILLIGCANLANLLLARASTRRQEVSVRFVLGASRWRVMRQLLTECLLLSLLGGLGGVVLAFWGKDFLTWVPSSDALVLDTGIDLRVMAFTAGLSVITALVCGLGPAWRATGVDLGPSMRTRAQKGGVTRGLARRALIIGQVAICLVLLVGTGLLLRTLHNLSTVDVGFNPDNLLVFRINPGQQSQSGQETRVFQLYEEMIAGIEAVPGVQSATLSAMPVIARAEWSERVRPDGAGEPQDAYVQVVRWNFFQTMGIPLVSGRVLSRADTATAPRVALINETMARLIFEDPNPVGRHFQFVEGRDANVAIQVAGIVRDAKYSSLAQIAPPTFYMPHTQTSATSMTFEVRTAADPVALAPAIREAVQRAAPGLSLFSVRTQRQQIADTIRTPRLFAVLTSVFSGVGLLLACTGLYGIVSFDVARRTGEIGIRMALGAGRSDVLRLVLRETIIVVLIGASLGLGVALAGAQLARSVLFGVAPTDPVTMGAAILLLATVATLAGFVPARRASRLDPTEALRYE